MLTQQAAIEICHTIFEGHNGEHAASAVNGQQQCQNSTDVYGNFNPTSLYYDVSATVEPLEWDYSTYGIVYKLGLTDVRLKLQKLSENAGTESAIINLFHFK